RQEHTHPPVLHAARLRRASDRTSRAHRHIGESGV
ncbi:hypothetical protein AVDCRST_MAG82-3334, partial [uncultured Rubrobacteraceae bacterium]